MDTVLLTLFLGLALCGGLYSASVLQGGARWGILAAVVAALAVLGSVAGHSWTGVALLNAAELAAVALVWSQDRAAAKRYLLAVVPAIVLTAAALWLINLGAVRPAAPVDKIAVALLIVGFSLKLGLVPVYFWLPAVAARTSAMTTALIVCVVDVASFGELYGLRLHSPWIFSDFGGVWLGLAVTSLLGGAVLALAQRDLKTMLAFSSIDDMGYLLIGLVAGGAGLSGTGFSLLSHALCKAALFGAVGIAEARIGQPVTLETRGLAAKVPVASATFMVAAFSFIGVPPGVGFIGHWRLYMVGTEMGGPALAVCMYVATALALLTYVRAIHRTWLGAESGILRDATLRAAPQDEVLSSPHAEEPAQPASRSMSTPRFRLAAAVVLIIALSTVVLGLRPSLLSLSDGPATHTASIAAWRAQ